VANSYVVVPPDSTGKKVATFEKTEATQVVQVQKVMLAGQTPDDDVLPITSAPAGTERAIPVRNIPSGTQPVSHAAASQADGHSATLGSTADADTASTVIGRLKKLISLLPTALVGDRLKVDGSGVTQPISAASLPLPTGAATETTLGTRLSESDFDTKTGSLTETAPATDTASSGLNGRLQRIAQRLTTLLSGGLPAALGAQGGLKIEGVASGTAVPVSGTVTANAGTGTRDVQGNVAHDSADSGNPVKVGGKARTTNPAAVADGDRVDSFHDDVGRAVVQPVQVRDLMTDATVTISASTAETTILASGGAGVFHDLTCVIVSNTSATATRVDFRSATSGSVRFSLYIPAGDTRGVVFSVPLPQTSAANNWTAQSSASVTDLRIFMQAAKNV
jgi:hypothetical protein